MDITCVINSPCLFLGTVSDFLLRDGVQLQKIYVRNMNQALPLHDASKPARQNDARASVASCSAHQLFLLLQTEHAASLSVLWLF